MSALEMARKFLAEARNMLEGYRRSGEEVAKRQACEKGWGAVAQALMHAAKRPLTTHRDFGDAASELYKKTGNPAILAGEASGETLHAAGFYHGGLSPEAIEYHLDQVEKLIEIIERISPTPEKDAGR